jgi:hypothetical protein
MTCPALAANHRQFLASEAFLIGEGRMEDDCFPKDDGDDEKSTKSVDSKIVFLATGRAERSN